jgi:hypothetical protein
MLGEVKEITIPVGAMSRRTFGCFTILVLLGETMSLTALQAKEEFVVVDGWILKRDDLYDFS